MGSGKTNEFDTRKLLFPHSSTQSGKFVCGKKCGWPTSMHCDITTNSEANSGPIFKCNLFFSSCFLLVEKPYQIEIVIQSSIYKRSIFLNLKTCL